MPTLFDPVTLGDLTLPNRIVMAPLTRSRGRDARAERADGPLRRARDGRPDHYRGNIGHAAGRRLRGHPGIWSDEQVEGWKQVTQAVHAAGGRIVLQLWHVGRISDPVFLNGDLPVAPSAIAAGGHVSLVRPQRPYVTPRALELDEIPGIVAAYRKGAENAKAAGFDGVEIHGANGYLLDQFLQDSTNHRADAWRPDREPRTPAARSGRRGDRRGAPAASACILPARRRAHDGRFRSGGNVRLCRARTRPSQDRLHLHA